MRRIQMLTLAATLLVAFSCKDAGVLPTAARPDMHPSRIVIGAPGATINALVSAGGWHTCALKTDGTIVCWGNNVEGETSIPAGLAPSTQMSTGFFTTCAVSTGGTVACWGDNYYGESTPPAGLTGAAQVSGGQYHSCARLTNGTVQCWGRADEGESDVPSSLASVTQISAGGLHSCALTTAGTVSCWGDNTFGESATPAGLGTVSQFSTGRYHTCAVVGAGVVCWGDNSSGESSVPAGLTGVTQVSAGLDQHSCALKSDGTVACWGDDSFGQSTPPAGLASVTEVSAGQYFSCAMKSDGSIVCWGSNASGQLSIPAGLNLNVVFPQSIAFISLVPNPAFTGSTYALTANATSGLPITYTSLTPIVCSVTGNTANFLTVGTCTIAANQAGDATHQPAPTQTQSINVAQLQVAQTITFTSSAPSPAYVGSSYTLAATTTSGLAITYKSLTLTVCTVTGNVAKFVAAGTCTVAADQAGDATHLAALEKTQSIAVSVSPVLPQTIAFRTAAPATANDGDHFDVIATGGASGNPVVLSSLTTANCTVHNNTVTIVHVGGCTIAENQAGNANYSAAPTKTATISATWAFKGFLGDVNNAPAVNTPHAGDNVNVKFKLNGSAGESIYAPGSPYSVPASCTTWAVTGPPVAAATANGRDKEKDKDWDHDGDNDDAVYKYMWKTDDAWGKTCRIFTVVLLDGTTHSAQFNFKK
jgi:Regulator of chromosome condensation (RCC1) repeat